MKFNNTKELKIGDWVTIKPKPFWDKLFGRKEVAKIDGLSMNALMREIYFGKRLQIKRIRFSNTNEVVYELKDDNDTCGWTKKMIE